MAGIYKQKDVMTIVKDEKSGGSNPPVITVYEAEFKDIFDLLTDLIGKNKFYVQRKLQNRITVLLRNLDNLVKARNVLLVSGLPTVMHTLEGPCSAGRPFDKENYKPALTLYGANTKEVINVLLNALGKDEFVISTTEKNVLSVRLSFMISFGLACTALMDCGYTIHTSDTFLVDYKLYVGNLKIGNTKCFRCHDYGHVAANCKAPMDDNHSCDSARSSDEESERFSLDSETFPPLETPAAASKDLVHKADKLKGKEGTADMFDACSRRYGDNFMETFVLLRQFAPEFNRIAKAKGEDEAMKALQRRLLKVEIK